MGRACRGKERSDWQRSLQDCGACGKHTGSPAAQPPNSSLPVAPLLCHWLCQMAHDSVLLIRAKALLRAFIVHHS